MSWRGHHPPREELAAWLDGELDTEHATRLKAHLGECAECAYVISAYRRHDDTLRSAFGVVVCGDNRPLLSLHRRRDRVRSLPHRWMAAAMMVMLILLGGGAAVWLGRPGDRSPEVATLGHDAIKAYRSVHTENGGLRADGLSRWASEAIGRQVQVPDLRQRGYRLVGKGLKTAGEGVAAILVFEADQARRIVCYFTEQRRSDESPLRYQREGDVAAFYRTDSHVGYAIAGNVDREELLAVAQSAYPPDD